MSHRTRIWDLPTRCFHWLLAAAVIALVVSAKVGGNAMVWHVRLGYAVMALLLFRIVWGLVGGRWSRFQSFLYSPRTTLQYLRGQGSDALGIGHSPTGSLSVFALLLVLAFQVASGLFSDDEIAFTGPLARFASSALVGQATWYHKDVGQWLVIALVVLHVAAVLFYLGIKKHNLIRPMLGGDKLLAVPAPASRDDMGSRALAAAVLTVCGLVAWWVSRL